MTGEAASSSDLCQRCGICCGDTMFDEIALEPGETEILLGHGYPAEGLRDQSFRVPCPLLVERKCSIYADRPAACRRFRCELLKAAENGTVSVEQALERVGQAHELLARLREIMPEGVSLERARARWKPADFEPGELDPSEAAAYMAFYAYYRFMDRHFRRPEKWLVTPLRDAAPAAVDGGISDASNDVA